MATYGMTIGEKEIFYIGPADSEKSDKRLAIPVQDFRYPQFVTIPNFDKEIKEKVAEFFKDSEPIIVIKSVDATQTIHRIFIENKRVFDEFDRE